MLPLRRNLGHQRAIAIGLAYVEQHIDNRCVVVMDSDGEDSPEDVPRLLARFEEEGGDKIVFAERTRRSETIIFKIFYLIYRWLDFLSDGGAGSGSGNFSVIPPRALAKPGRCLVVLEPAMCRGRSSQQSASARLQPACQELSGADGRTSWDSVIHGLTPFRLR